MLDEIAEKLREDKKCQDLLTFLFELSSGRPCEIRKPVYVSMASKKLGISTKEVRNHFQILRELKLVEENPDDQKIIIGKDAEKYVPDYIRSRYTY